MPTISKASKNKSILGDAGNVADLFSQMYKVAHSLAAQEGLLWIQVKHTQYAMDNLQSAINEKKIDDKSLPPLLQTELFNFITQKRDEYLNKMVQLAELAMKMKQENHK